MDSDDCQGFFSFFTVEIRAPFLPYKSFWCLGIYTELENGTVVKNSAVVYWAHNTSPMACLLSSTKKKKVL